MTSSASRGLLIVVEGLDRSGKTSQCQLLVEGIEKSGSKVRYVKFPDRTTPSGQMINAYLTGKADQDDHSIHLLFSANRWEAVKRILADINDGITIVIDRYSFSGAVYSAAKNNPDLSLEWAWNPEIGLPKPDLAFFLDISSEAAAKRGGYGEERYETEKMQSRVRTLFKDLFSQIEDLNVHVIDAGNSIEQVSSDITTHFQQATKSIDFQASLQKLGPLR